MSVSSVVIDDHLLLQMLLAEEPPDVRPLGAVVSTTGLWYHRLCRALSNPTVTGAMSRSLSDLDAPAARRVVGSVVELPESIGVTSLRSLGWQMAELLTHGVRLNLLSLEALAAAEHLGATICLATVDDNPALRDAAQRRGVSVRLITP